MTIKFIKKPKINDFENNCFTFDKEYFVLADYRNRVSGQCIRDNGLVITNDMKQNQMIFLADGFEIVDSEPNGTYIFKRKDGEK